MDSPQNIISFCTGYGGIELGLRRAGLDARAVCYVEVEAFVQANLVAKIEEGKMDAAPIWSNIKTFSAQEFRGKVDGIIGGYPCQPFSNAGLRKGEEDPRHLWPYIRKHIQAIRPSWAFFENVEGHISLGLSTVISDLEEDGYETTWGIFSAEEVGAPHQRKRVFILAKFPDSGSSHGGKVFTTKERSKANPEKPQPDCNGDKRGADKLGNSSSVGSCRRREDCDCKQSEMPRPGLEPDAKLAHTKNGRGKPSKSNGREGLERGSSDRGGATEERKETKWPARPGEEQYEWEEPRVTEAQSELGGAVDGTTGGVDPIANRVDRLRLLGNGVVPQTAELAWKTLWNELNQNL